MPVLEHKLEVMSGIGLVGARELDAEMLADLGPASGGIGLRGAEVVDPENPRLVAVKRAWLAVGGGGEMMLQKSRDGQHPALFLPGESDQAGLLKTPAHVGGDPAVFLQERAGLGRPTRGGFLQDLACFFAAEFPGLPGQLGAEFFHEGAAQRLHLGERVGQPRFFPDQRLKVRATDGKPGRRPGRLVFRGAPVTIKCAGGFAGELPGFLRSGRERGELSREFLKKRPGVFAALLRESGPKRHGPPQARGAFGEKPGDLGEPAFDGGPDPGEPVRVADDQVEEAVEGGVAMDLGVGAPGLERAVPE